MKKEHHLSHAEEIKGGKHSHSHLAKAKKHMAKKGHHNKVMGAKYSKEDLHEAHKHLKMHGG